MSKQEAGKTTLNFSKLEKELNSSIEADRKYWLENDAKFRAVHQKVGSYDEFCDIVKAAHLKPLEKHDKVCLERKFAPWNPTAGKQSASSATGASSAPDASLPLPRSCAEFASFWKRATPEQRKDLLINKLSADQLQNIFAMDLPIDILPEIVAVLCNSTVSLAGDSADYKTETDNNIPIDDTATVAMGKDHNSSHDEDSEETSIEMVKMTCLKLKALTETRRFRLTIDFLDTQDLSKISSSLLDFANRVPPDSDIGKDLACVLSDFGVCPSSP